MTSSDSLHHIDSDFLISSYTDVYQTNLQPHSAVSLGSARSHSVIWQTVSCVHPNPNHPGYYVGFWLLLVTKHRHRIPDHHWFAFASGWTLAIKSLRIPSQDRHPDRSLHAETFCISLFMSADQQHGGILTHRFAKLRVTRYTSNNQFS